MLLPKLPAGNFNRFIFEDPWETPPVTIEEFILSQKYLDLGNQIYPRIFDILVHIFGNNPKELYQFNDVNFLGGIGCLSGETKIIDTNGILHNIRDLVGKELEVFCINKEGNAIKKRKAIGKYSGLKKTNKIRTESGRVIYATSNHLFYTDTGWKEASKLLNRAILVANKLDFNVTKKYPMGVEKQNRFLKNLIHAGNNTQDKNIEEFYDFAQYQTEHLEDFLQKIKDTSISSYDLYAKGNPILKSIGLRTGDLFSEDEGAILRFRNKNEHLPNLLFDRVVEVSESIEEPVYDLEVEEFENFILYDGTIVHNSGKTYLGSIAQTYIFYKLCCLRDCRKYLGGADDKPMSLVNCAPSAEKAQKLVFSGIKENISRCDYFKKISLIAQSREVKRFKNGKQDINVFSGSSTPNSVIGLNVFSAIIDETCFFEKNSEKDYFEELYKGIKDRIASRFGDKGLVICLSSPMSVDDYAWQRLNQVKKVGEDFYLPKNNSIRQLQI